MQKRTLLPLTTLPFLHSKRNQRSDETKSVNDSYLLNSSNKREDNRDYFEARPLYVQTGVSQQGTGSCYLSQGKSMKLFCSVFGPKQVPARYIRSTGQHHVVEHGIVIIDVIFSPFSHIHRGRITSLKSYPGQMSKKFSEQHIDENLSTALIETFSSVILTEKFQNLCIEISLFVLECFDASLFSCAINCITLALIDGSIPIRDLCVATSLGLFRKRKSNSTANHIDDNSLNDNKNEEFILLDIEKPVTVSQTCKSTEEIINSVFHEMLKSSSQKMNCKSTDETGKYLGKKTEQKISSKKPETSFTKPLSLKLLLDKYPTDTSIDTEIEIKDNSLESDTHRNNVSFTFDDYVVLVDPTQKEFAHHSYVGSLTVGLCAATSDVCYMNGSFGVLSHFELIDQLFLVAEHACFCLGEMLKKQIKNQIFLKEQKYDLETKLEEKIQQVCNSRST